MHISLAEGNGARACAYGRKQVCIHIVIHLRLTMENLVNYFSKTQAIGALGIAIDILDNLNIYLRSCNMYCFHVFNQPIYIHGQCCNSAVDIMMHIATRV